MEKNLTLAKALELIVRLKENARDLEKELMSDIGSESYRGEKLREMTINRMLYHIAIFEQMDYTLSRFASEFGSTDEEIQIMGYLSELESNRSVISKMKASIITKADIEGRKEKAHLLQEYVETFSEAQRKKIRKEELVNQLRLLGL